MLKDVAAKGRAGSVRRARRLRRDMSLPEVLLWQRLRTQPEGLKFRRQHPSGVYVLDFYCADARLAIEIYGIAHDLGDRPERDARRDAWLADMGVATRRVPAADVLADPDAVADIITRYAMLRLPLHHPAAPDGPPPRA